VVGIRRVGDAARQAVVAEWQRAGRPGTRRADNPAQDDAPEIGEGRGRRKTDVPGTVGPALTARAGAASVIRSRSKHYFDFIIIIMTDGGRG